jgi:hypothetical protein
VVTVFICCDGNQTDNYLRWWSLSLFFLEVHFSVKRQQGEGLTRHSNVRTEGTDPGTCIGTWNGRVWWDQGYLQMFFYWPVVTERGQGEGITLQGILGEGMSTWSTGCFVYVIMTSPPTPRDGGWRDTVREEEQTHTGGTVVEVLTEWNSCSSPTSGQLDWTPLSSRNHYRSTWNLQVRVWWGTRGGMVKHRRTRMSTRGLTNYLEWRWSPELFISPRQYLLLTAILFIINR